MLALGMVSSCALLDSLFMNYLSFDSDFDPWTQGIDSSVDLSAASIGKVYKVVVPPKPLSLDISNPLVWGTAVYTTDSRIGPAAVHAGVIASSGGTVYVEILAGQDNYLSSTANGVTTMDYSSWGYSYRFTTAN